MNIKIGCTGWSYQGWSSTFYPRNLKSSEWLKYYSQIFEITEINSTFYRIPAQEIVRRWNADTPRHFRFTAKFPSIITHEKRLDRVNSEVFSFLASLAPIHEKISALILQLPPSLSFDRPRRDRHPQPAGAKESPYLRQLRRAAGYLSQTAVRRRCTRRGIYRRGRQLLLRR